MYVNRVNGTCSMITIGNNPNFKKISEIEFLQKLSDACKEAEIAKEQVKCVILTTNDTWLERIFIRVFDFERIGSYAGNSGNRVHIMMRTFPKGLLDHIRNYNKKRGTIKI